MRMLNLVNVNETMLGVEGNSKLFYFYVTWYCGYTLNVHCKSFSVLCIDGYNLFLDNFQTLGIMLKAEYLIVYKTIHSMYLDAMNQNPLYGLVLAKAYNFPCVFGNVKSRTGQGCALTISVFLVMF